MSQRTIYEILNIRKEDIPHSECAHHCTQTYVHYYRLRSAYYAHVNKIPYHNYVYRLFPFNYASYVQDNADYLDYIIFNLRSSKNSVLNPHIENYRYYYYDRNRSMYYATKHLIRQLYYYYEYIMNSDSLSSPERDDDYVQTILDAYTLFYYILDREDILDDNEVNQLIEFELSLNEN